MCLLAIVKDAKQNHISRIFAEVSITAKPFFESKGFHVKQQTIVRKGIELTNYIMEKNIN
jgi:putative acetyltransferase